jgi:hypothetical protein
VGFAVGFCGSERYFFVDGGAANATIAVITTANTTLDDMSRLVIGFVILLPINREGLNGLIAQNRQAKPFKRFRNTEAVEEPLDGVPGEDELQILAVVSGEVGEPRADRGGDVRGLFVFHRTASR